MKDTRKPQLLSANVFHGRKGNTDNSFTYKADYILFPIGNDEPDLPLGLTRNKVGLWSLNDKDLGDGKHNLNAYAQHLIEVCNLPPHTHHCIELLTMPSFLGYCFNPISFWLFKDTKQQLRAVVVEVTNVGRDRHSYLCRHDDYSPIKSKDAIIQSKRLHVSPFQNLDGDYEFKLDLNSNFINVRIKYDSPTDDGMVATLSGHLEPLRTSSLIKSSVTLPLGALRVMTLIHWQALKLKIKGAQFRRRPCPPEQELSQ